MRGASPAPGGRVPGPRLESLGPRAVGWGLCSCQRRTLQGFQKGDCSWSLGEAEMFQAAGENVLVCAATVWSSVDKG